MIGLLGNGSWATAIAKILTDNQQPIHWWMRKEEAVQSLKERQHNIPYLSSVSFDKELIFPSTDLMSVIEKSETIIFCIPSAYLKHFLDEIPHTALQGKKIVSAVKGILPEVNLLLSDFLVQSFGLNIEDYISITGPCHAEEVAMERLSYLTFSCLDKNKATAIAHLFENKYLKTVVNTDVQGTQYAAVLKNVYAVGAGMAHGMGYGDNFMSVYATNCYRELFGFVNTISDAAEELISSAYLGDLLVTCYSLHSRNRRLGSLLGQGYSIQAAIIELGMVAEGYPAVKGMHAILQKLNIQLPILQEIYETLWQQKPATKAFKNIENLMQ